MAILCWAAKNSLRGTLPLLTVLSLDYFMVKRIYICTNVHTHRRKDLQTFPEVRTRWLLSETFNN